MSDAQYAHIIWLHYVQLTLKLLIFLALLACIAAILRYVRQSRKDTADLLNISKSYLEMGRTRHTDSQQVLEKVAERMDAAPSLARAVEQVPDKTAEKVLHALDEKKADSGVNKIPPAGGP